MSQQEFFPSSQSSKQDELADVEIAHQRPISWSNKSRTGDVTKNEHPSTYEEESLPPYSYAAQDRHSVRPTRREQKEEPLRTTSNIPGSTMRQRTRQSFSPDGDAMEYGYRPFRTTSQTPPLHKRRSNMLRVIFLVIGILLLLKVLPFLATAIVALLGIGLFLVILPVLIVLAFVIVFAALVLMLLSRLGFPVWRNLFHRSRWRWRW